MVTFTVKVAHTKRRFLSIIFLIGLISNDAYGDDLGSLSLPNCPGGGGAIFESPHYTFNHQLKEFKSTHKCVKGESLPKESNQKYFELFNKVKEKIKEIEKDKSCVSLLGIIEKYNQGLQDSSQKSVGEFKQLKVAFDSFPKEFVQKYHAAWSWHSAGCAAAKLTFDIKAHWRLYHDLHTHKEDSRALSVQENGEEIDSCANVTASGSENLDEFIVKTDKSISKKINISFDPYHIPDQLKVFEGSKLVWDSGCKGTEEALQKEITLSRIGSRLKLKVNANCDGQNATAWFLKVNCLTEEPNKPNSKCGKFRSDLKGALKTYLDNGKPTFNGTYYNQVLCYEDLNSEVVNKFNNLLGGGFKVATQSHCDKEKPCKSKFGELPVNLLPRTKTKAIEKRKERKKIKLSTDECPTLIKKSDSIFEIVSRAYCLYGFDKIDIYQDQLK